MNQRMNSKHFGLILFFSCCCNLFTSSKAIGAEPLTVWHDRTPTNRNIGFKQVVFAGDRFLAFGRKGSNCNEIWTSSDGAAWTGHSTGTTNREFTSAAFGNGTFVALGNICLSASSRKAVFETALVTSTNAVNWKPLSEDESPVPKISNIEVGPLAFGNGQFLMIGREPDAKGFGRMLAWTSTNGRNWTVYRPSLIWPPFTLNYLKDRFVSVDPIGRVLSIHDLDLWTKTSNRGAELWPSGAFALSGAAYGNGKFVLIGDSWNSALTAVSTNGKDWSRAELPLNPQPLPNKPQLSAVAFGNGLFVATGLNCTVVVSENGLNWSSRVVSTNRSFTSTAFGKETFVLVGGNSEIMQSDPVPK